MSEIKVLDQLENYLLAAGRSFAYPPTPDIAGAILRPPSPGRSPRRRWAYALAIVLVAITALLAIPEARARILDFLQIGAIRIDTPVNNPAEEVTEQNGLDQVGPLIPISDLIGETSLEEARRAVDFGIPLPAYPADLGEPDHVYIQQLEPRETFVIMTWMEPEDPERVAMAIYVIGPGVSLTKGPVDQIRAVSVAGAPAAYIRGAHFLQANGVEDYGVLVQSPALIWETEGITYRIEAELPLDELIQIAESLTGN